MVNEVVGSTLFPVFVGDSLVWDKIGVMFAFTQFAGLFL